MTTLKQIAQHQPQWSLDEFVKVVNDWLPQILPATKSSSRKRDDVNPRLVRHYATQGLLDEPLKAGREARYTYRHLLQMLVVRRLLAEGMGVSAIGDLMVSKTNAELEALLYGGIQITVSPANPALSYLQDIQQRSRTAGQADPSVRRSRAQPQPTSLSTPLSTTEAAIPSAAAPPSSAPVSHRWTRLEVLPGFELHIREDFTLPKSSQEQQNLFRLVRQTLIHLLHT
jgi:DNA-binding transcriptional MerR regulator